MAKVYRVEYRETGKGVYNSGIGFECSAYVLWRDYKIGRETPHEPCPDYDSGLSRWWKSINKKDYHAARDYFCGFVSEQQMHTWFPPEGFSKMIEKITRPGYSGPTDLVVAVYEVDGRTIHRGTHQCMFNIEEAKLIEYRDLSRYAMQEFALAA